MLELAQLPCDLGTRGCRRPWPIIFSLLIRAARIILPPPSASVRISNLPTVSFEARRHCGELIKSARCGAEFRKSDAASAAGRSLELTPQECCRLMLFPMPVNRCCLPISVEEVLHD